ncbi:MAG: DUF4252 domain-containing protein [Schleiferiaceae bacterium]|jgi:hypothetical protein|nr:DUF4252 domain-containing protein [Schleiferiaceae bacterium]
MNKLKLLTLTFLIGILTATAQKSNAIQKVYDKYENEDNVFALSLSKQLDNALDTDFNWGDELKNIEGDISKMSTLIVSENSDSRKMLLNMKRMIGNLGYSDLDLPEESTDDSEDKAYLFTRGKKGKYSEIHLLVIEEDGSGVLVSLFGDFTVKNAS